MRTAPHVWHMEPSPGCTEKNNVKNTLKVNTWIIGATGCVGGGRGSEVVEGASRARGVCLPSD